MQEHRQRVYRVEGIILARQDWGEADRMVVLFSLERGKLRVVAPGARKQSSRKSGHLELFTRGRFVLARGRSLDKLTQAETIDYFPGVRQNLENIAVAYLMAELVDRFLEEEDENARLYHLLQQALSSLDQDDPTTLLRLFFQLQALEYLGYQPNFFSCQACEDALAPIDQFFSLTEGGVICPTCRKKVTYHFTLSLEALKVLRFMQTANWETVRRLRLTPYLANEVERLLRRYVAFHLGGELRATRFMEQLKRMGEES